MSDGQLGGLVAVVTGGSSGIGAAIARQLATEGARVAILDRDPESADPQHYAVSCDVASRPSATRAIGSVAQHFGGIDLLVNNAGVGARGNVSDNDDEEWARVLSVNVTGIARTTAAALPWLRSSGSAAICNVTSIAANVGLPQRALYSASKGAAVALTRAMAADHLKDGIRVNGVNPGTVDTPWVKRLLAESDDPTATLNTLRSRQPHGRLVSPEEVAGAVLYLVSPQSGSTTGTFIDVDGGLSSLRLPG